MLGRFMKQALRCDQKPNSAVNIMWQLFQNFPMIHLGTSYIQKSLLSCIYGKASSTWSCAVIRLITLLWKFISDKKRALKSLVISTLMLHGSRLVIFFFFDWESPANQVQGLSPDFLQLSWPTRTLWSYLLQTEAQGALRLLKQERL